MNKIKTFIRLYSVSIAVAIIVIAMGAILFFQTIALNRLQQNLSAQQQIIAQVKDVTNSINQKSQERTDQINQLNRHMDCIVLFFAQEDRATKSISDIDACTLKDNQSGALSLPTTGVTGILTPTDSSTTQTAQAAPTQTTAQPTTSATTQSTTPQTTATTSTAPIQQPVTQPSFVQRTIVEPIKNLLNDIL